VMNELFVRKLHSLVNVHSKGHGVMCIKGSNSADDNILISTGYKDDGRIRVWDYMERSTISECHNLRGESRDTLYNICLMTFKSAQQIEHEGSIKIDQDIIDDFSHSRLIVTQ
jgi:WD40 repeat protein